MKKILITFAVLIVVGGVYYLTADQETQMPTLMPTTSASAVKTPAAGNITVNIKNFIFDPATITVKPGTRVTWVNNDSVPHTVTSDSGSLLNSGTLAPGQSFSFSFSSATSVNYHCVLHPAMKGVVIVSN